MTCWELTVDLNGILFAILWSWLAIKLFEEELK